MRPIFQRVKEYDIDQLCKIARSTFYDAYYHLNTPSNFEWYCNRAFSKQKLLQEIQNPESFFFFVSINSNIIGYLKLNIGLSQTEDLGDEYVEIERIYVVTEFQRQGIGKIMIDFALKEARRWSKPKIWLGVWDQNPGAIAFYELMGFIRTGSHIFQFGNEDQIDIIMQKTV